jgi:hypothetical protein
MGPIGVTTGRPHETNRRCCAAVVCALLLLTAAEPAAAVCRTAAEAEGEGRPSDPAAAASSAGVARSSPRWFRSPLVASRAAASDSAQPCLLSLTSPAGPAACPSNGPGGGTPLRC